MKILQQGNKNCYKTLCFQLFTHVITLCIILLFQRCKDNNNNFLQDLGNIWRTILNISGTSLQPNISKIFHHLPYIQLPKVCEILLKQLLPLFSIIRAYPGSEFVVANTLIKWKTLKPNEINSSQSFSQKVVSTSCSVFNSLPASGDLLSADNLCKHLRPRSGPTKWRA